MEITSEIKQAINEACKHHGGQRRFADQVGLLPSNISRYLSGKVTQITLPNLAKLWPLICDYLPVEQRDSIGKYTIADNIANHRKGDFERAYTVLQMMMRSVCEIGADELFMQIIMYWPGMDEEQRKAAYVAVREIAEPPTEEEPKP